MGSHTYTHVNLSLCDDERVRIELNATQRLLQTITGRSTTLFRPPYEADSRPNEISEITPLLIAQDLDYLTVSWKASTHRTTNVPGADVILQKVKQQRRNGSILLLHDAGGDRSQTVEALPKIIDYLRSRGDQIVSVSALLGTTRDAVNPRLKAGDRSLARIASNIGFRALHVAFGFLWAFMIVATILIVLRTILVIILALVQRRKKRAASGPFPLRDRRREQAAGSERDYRRLQRGKSDRRDFAVGSWTRIMKARSRCSSSTMVPRIGLGRRRGRWPPPIRPCVLLNRRTPARAKRCAAAWTWPVTTFSCFSTRTRFSSGTRSAISSCRFADPKVGAVSGHARVGNSAQLHRALSGVGIHLRV